jgi:hypothetical protein
MQEPQFSSDDPFVVGIPTRKSGDHEMWDQMAAPVERRPSAWAKAIAVLSAVSLLLLAALPL